MLGKLLKYEFRATGRSMLPVLGVLTLLVLLANISVRLLDRTAGAFLTILLIMVIFLQKGRVVLHQAADSLREEKGKSVDQYFREVFKC